MAEIHDTILKSLNDMKETIGRMEQLVRQHQRGQIKIGRQWANLPAATNGIFADEYTFFLQQLKAQFAALPKFTGVEK